MSGEPYTEGVDFILGEVIRFAQMDWAELKTHLPSLGWSDLPDAAGRGRIVSHEAVERLRFLTELALEASPYRGRVDFRRAFDETRKSFGQTFIRADLPYPSEDGLRELFASWVSKAAEDRRPRTHLIPCDLSLDGVDEFNVGPIKIFRRDYRWPALEAELESYASTGEDYRDEAAKAAREYLQAFGEIAEVEVPDCDGPTSRVVAERTLQALLDFIHVMAGAAYTKRMRGPGPALLADRRSTIVRTGNGEFEIAYSVSWGGANLSPEAWRDLAGPNVMDEVAPFARALTRIASCESLPLLADRFIDACRWYGDAAREASPAAAAVKYVTVMERLL